jgi:multidrug efflux pump
LGHRHRHLRTAIAAANANSAKGSFDGPKRSYSINANDQLLTADDYKKLIVAYKNGAPVRLIDVARVVESAENNRLGAWAGSKGELQAGDHPQRPAPAGRERHRHGRRDQAPAARPAGVAAGEPQGRGAGRPHQGHPRLGRARRDRAGAGGGDGGAGDLRLPRQPARDPDRQPGGADLADRQLRRDVPARLQPQQPEPDGADDRHRLRRRRRDRHDREHLAPSRDGEGGRSKASAADREAQAQAPRS